MMQRIKLLGQMMIYCDLALALLLITGIILAVVLLRRQRKLNRKLDELTLLLKEKEKEENPEN